MSQDQQQNSGFVDESAIPAPVAETNEAGAKKARKITKKEEMWANLTSVFGSGFGKIAIILVVAFLVIAAALISRALWGPSKSAGGKPGNVDVPSAPPPTVNVDAIDSREAARRSQQSNLEAEQAAAAGKSYQAEFTPVITQAAQQNGQQAAAGQGGVTPPLVGNNNTAQANQQPVQITVATGQQNVNAANDQQQQAELDRRRAERDKNVADLRTAVMDRIKLLVGEGQGATVAGANSRGSYTATNYMPAQKPATQQSGVAAPAAPAQAATPQIAASGTNAAGQKLAFKAGKVGFAETDAEVNTDDGGDVFATMRGGKYDGARLIGKIEVTPRNIRLRFSTLAPQDDRPTLSINAVAIREEDAKQGVADTIDNHTLERYSALFASSILSGLGKAAQQPQGNVIILPNGQTITEQAELTNKRLAMFALGDVGTNAAGEVKKLVEQPPTYKIAAHRGLGIIFLSDVPEVSAK